MWVFIPPAKEGTHGTEFELGQFDGEFGVVGDDPLVSLGHVYQRVFAVLAVDELDEADIQA